MTFRRFAAICGPVASLALGISFSSAALAQDVAHVEHGQLDPVPPAPDMRPAWQGAAPQVLMPDAPTREAWLRECHHRTAMYYGGFHKRRRHHDDRMDHRGLSYCEAYFDDYYRNYRGYAQGYAYIVPVAAPMMMHAPMMQEQKPECREVETVSYEPIRTRVIPRRAPPRRVLHDKRIRVTPDKRLPLD